MLPFKVYSSDEKRLIHEQIIAGNRISYCLTRGTFQGPGKREYFGALIENVDSGESAGANLSETIGVSLIALAALCKYNVTPTTFFDVIDNILEMALKTIEICEAQLIWQREGAFEMLADEVV